MSFTRLLGVFAVWSLLLTSAHLLPAAAYNPVVEPIVDRGVTLELRPLVQLPNSNFGPARVNQLTYRGQDLYGVADRAGRIYRIDRSTAPASVSLYFDVKAAIAIASNRTLDTSNLFHGGLRSIAFHPNFATNGKLYTSVMETRPSSPDPLQYLSDVTNPISADGVLIEWTADPMTGVVDPMSYRVVFRVGMPVFDHPIKQISFNPTSKPGSHDYGLLYVAHGDGSVQSASAGGGQNNDALGKILRIDPLANGEQAFTVPTSNPFVGDPTMLDAVYSLGHRNPHHLAFATDTTGESRLIVAEPGRDNIEEINLISAGADYGWPLREGTFVNLADGGLGRGIAPLPTNEAALGLTYPAAQYGHEGDFGTQFFGQAVAGGFVVDNNSALHGEYFFADFPISGQVFHSRFDDLTSATTQLDPTDPSRDQPAELTQAVVAEASILFDHDADRATAALRKDNLLDVFDDAASHDGRGRADVRFGQGPDGELYVMSKRNGWIYLVTNSVAPTRPMCEGQIVTVDLGLGEVPTPFDDVIVGTDGNDVIDGGSGDDVICGLGGDDTINGADGKDRIIGGAGNDQLFGGDGRDVIQGGRGDDHIEGGRRIDRLSGNAGNDTIRGQDGKDQIRGHDGQDVLFGGGGNDLVIGGPGQDWAHGGTSTDRCIAERVRKCERSE